MAEEELKGKEGKAEEKGKEEAGEPEKPIDKMTAPELRDIAKQIPGVSGVHAMKKAELLALVKEYKGIEAEAPTKKKAEKKKKIQSNVKELKKKIQELKAEKLSAREAKDWKRVDLLRRRINRSKKLTRKAPKG